MASLCQLAPSDPEVSVDNHWDRSRFAGSMWEIPPHRGLGVRYRKWSQSELSRGTHVVPDKKKDVEDSP